MVAYSTGQCGVIAGPGVGVEQPANQLVVGIAGIAEVNEELAAIGIDGLSIAADQALHFGASWLGICGRSEARQAGDILAEMSAGTEIVVPTAHVLAGRGKPDALAVDLEKAVLAEVEEEAVGLVELLLQRARQEFNGAIRKSCQVGADRGDHGCL